MKIWTFSLCRNSADILPFWLMHYDSFVDRMHVWDDASTDGSQYILTDYPKVKLWKWPYPNSGIDEDLFLKFAYETYPMAAGKADWVMWVDTDEFIYHPNIVEVLAQADKDGFNVIQPEGFNMISDGMPKDDGRQIWEICNMGVPAPVYSKPVVFKPDISIQWVRGKHMLENCHPSVTKTTGVKLLHYRYLGYEYTKKKNANNYGRCGLANGDKNAAWSCAPDWKGAHSAEWAEAQKQFAVKIL